MSRLRLFMQGVASTYIALAASVLYSLVSVPLVLKFLTIERFGLWGLLTQFASYVWLIDAGMSPAFFRVLIERKDRPSDGAYGSLIQTGFFVAATQAALVLAVGLGLAGPLSELSRIPAELQGTFCALVWWQSGISAIMFGGRIFRSVLIAHQRNDLVNCILAASSMVGLATLWLALLYGAGVYSILWANAAATLFVTFAIVWSCWRIHVFPIRGAWGRASWNDFKSLFAYGKDLFIIQIGSMSIMAAQPIIVSRSLGLEAVAAWSVGTKAFSLVFGLLSQALDVSGPAFSEMIVRGEAERLRQRFVGMLVIVGTVSGFVAVLYATCNSMFVTMWTHGRISWPAHYDVLLGVWLFVLIYSHASNGFFVLTKRIAGMRYVFLMEGVTVVALAALLTKHGGIAAMIGCSLGGSLCFRGAYAAWRTHSYFGFQRFEMERQWFFPLARILGCVLCRQRWLCFGRALC
jgi:O-antigen/teichoic acid export membrane protein